MEDVVVNKIFQMESSLDQANNIAVNREIGCLATNDAKCKKQLLEEIATRNKKCHVIGAKSRVMDTEEIDSVEKTNKKRRRSSEKRVRFSDTVDIYEEPMSRFRTLDDGDEDFSSLVTVPQRGIFTSRLSRDCINVEDFQEQYNQMNKGTSVWRRRQRQRFNKKSFGDFIGSQDFTAPLATMEEIECFCDESPDSSFKDFGECEEESPVLSENVRLTQEEYIHEDSGDEDCTAKTCMAKDTAPEYLIYKAPVQDTSAFQPLLPAELLSLKDLGSDMQDTFATEGDGFTEDRINAQVVGVWAESRCSPEAPDGPVSLAAAAAALPLEPASTDEARKSPQHEWMAECDAINGNLTKDETADVLTWNVREPDGLLATSAAVTGLPDEVMMTGKVTVTIRLLATNGEAKLDELLATNEIMTIDESKIPTPDEIIIIDGSKVPVPDEILMTDGSKVPVPDEILMTEGSKVPVPDEILMTDGSKVPDESKVPVPDEILVTDGSRMSVPDEVNKSIAPEESVMIGKITVPDKLLEINIVHVSNEGDKVPDEGVTVPDEGITLPDGVTVPDEGVTVPDEGDRVPDEGVTIPDERVTVPDEGVTVLDEGDRVPDEGVTFSGELFMEIAVKVPDDHLFGREGVPREQAAENEVRQLDDYQSTDEFKQTDEFVTRNETLGKSSTADENTVGENYFERVDDRRLTSGEVEFQLRSAVKEPEEFSAEDEVPSDAGRLSFPENSQGSSTVMSALHSSASGRDILKKANQFVFSGESGDNSLSDIQMCNSKNSTEIQYSDFISNISHDSISGHSDEMTICSLSNSRVSVLRCFTCILIPNLVWLFRCDPSPSWEVETEYAPSVQVKRPMGVRKWSAGSATPRASRLATGVGNMKKARPQPGFS